MSEVSISVITPVWQGERFLREALESIRAQTRPADEAIVVDDGSTDESVAIADELAAEWPVLRVLRRENGGSAAARNTGISAATGDLITFLDADDLMVPTRLEQQAAYLAAQPEADVVIGREELLVEEGVSAPAWIRAGDDGRPRPYLMSMMARRAVLERIGAFDPSFRLSQDLEWMVRARAAGVRVDTLDEVLIRRRMHGGNVVYRTEEIRRAMLQTIRTRLAAREETT